MPSGAVKRRKQARRKWRWLLPLCIVLVLVLAAFFLFRLRNVSPFITNSATSSNTDTSASSNQSVSSSFPGWNSAVIAVATPGASSVFSLRNYDPMSGKQRELVLQPPYLPQNTSIDGVSHDGKNLLYQFSSDGHTLYYTLSLTAATGYFYELNGASAGNALWFPDSRAALVLSVRSRVMKVDIQTGVAQTVLPLPVAMSDGQQVQIDRLAFYLNGYLYFVGADGACEETLCRVSLDAKNPVAQRISFQSKEAAYWLSPDGSTIFFENNIGPAGEPGIYAVGVDGSNLRLIRQQYKDARIVGYAADNAPELVVDQDGTFNLVKLGETAQLDSVARKDVAPGAANLCTATDLPSTRSICDSNLALSPNGHTLLVAAVLADGSYKVWTNDLTNGKQSLLLAVSGGSQVTLGGWDMLPDR